MSTPAEQHAEAAAAGHDEAEDAHRLRPLAGSVKRVMISERATADDDRAAEPLHRARGDEHALAWSRARRRARRR